MSRYKVTKQVATSALVDHDCYHGVILVKFPAPGSHVFQTTRTIFKLVQYIIGTNLLTKFHEDRTINVAFRVLTRQMLTLHDAQHTNVITKTLHEHIVRVCTKMETNYFCDTHSEQ
ncbi:hypothetical protein DPMN_079060 [Dreissena polymorpha]|uniref:Uncharacterized protein n=1 Tax=Dreissena polymorpha TaxID=45954 RepID=A0A9D3YRT8_DREPO|nr:hypothetical protein DPMN_079060 [Dreissena polymorpha]